MFLSTLFLSSGLACDCATTNALPSIWPLWALWPLCWKPSSSVLSNQNQRRTFSVAGFHFIWSFCYSCCTVEPEERLRGLLGMVVIWVKPLEFQCFLS